MKRIEFDARKCTGLGICESLAPDHFETTDDGSMTVLVGEVTAADESLIAEAVRSCPTAALRLVDVS